jgi:tRNA threonylcarbamoyladenosine modification (KEOPS) complex  Pcc1 subunit
MRYNQSVYSLCNARDTKAMTTAVSEYVFKIKKGDLELEVRSNDSAFMDAQVETWRNVLVQPTTTAGVAQ